MYKNPLFRNGEENENVIQNPHADPNHHQKLSCPCMPRLVDVRFRVRQLSCLQNDRHNDHITPALLTEVIIVSEVYENINSSLKNSIKHLTEP